MYVLENIFLFYNHATSYINDWINERLWTSIIVLGLGKKGKNIETKILHNCVYDFTKLWPMSD